MINLTRKIRVTVEFSLDFETVDREAARAALEKIITRAKTKLEADQALEDVFNREIFDSEETLLYGGGITSVVIE